MTRQRLTSERSTQGAQTEVVDGSDRSRPPSLSDRELALFAAWIRRHAGLNYPETKRVLLARRLSKRLAALGLTNFTEYYRLLPELGAKETVLLLDCLCTHETHFFREPRHFELLESDVIPLWQGLAQAGRRSRHVRVWSAASSTGEEAYSVAMTLLTHLPREEGWQVEVFATDLSSWAVERTRAGVWDARRAAEIPEPYLKRFMLKGRNAEVGKIKAGPELAAVVRAFRWNLNDPAGSVADKPAAPSLGLFDLIFCRNVLIYFDAETRDQVLHRLVARLRPDGWLFLGHAETLTGSTLPLRAVAPTVYRPLDASLLSVPRTESR